jgi:formylglycine-generating enzyme required for sulfatase activity
MPLFPCPDCSLTVSDQAPTCPRCGRPLLSPVVAAPTPVPKTAVEPRQALLALNLVSTAVVVLGVFGTVLVRSIGDRGPVSDERTAGTALPEASALSSAAPAVSSAVSKAAPAQSSGEMVPIPAGVLHREADAEEEDEKSSGDIAIAAFYLDVTEVTLGAWNHCQADGTCRKAPTELTGVDLTDADKKYKKFCTGSDPKLAMNPINCVSWSEAETFCKWAKKRLPTEAEWEYAAHAGSKQKYPWGDGAPEAGANHCGSECTKILARENLLEPGQKPIENADDGFPSTSPVRSYPKNAFKVFDMGGNVSEWVADVYAPQLSAKPPATGEKRVSKGSNWQTRLLPSTRIAKRWKDLPTTRDTIIGFRCAKDGP